jgi:hypothetical protein
MMAVDENLRLMNGTLPHDPFEDADPVSDPNMPPTAWFADEVPANEAAPPASPWDTRIVPAKAEWFAIPPPKRDWLLRDQRTDHAAGVLPLGKVGQMIGEGGVSKTMAVMQLGLSGVTGLPWLGTFSIPTPGRVLMVLGEEDAEEVQRRAFHAARAVTLPAFDPSLLVTLPLASVPCAMLDKDPAGNPVESDFFRWFMGYVGTLADLRLIVVDPLSRFAGLDAETDNAAATRFIQALEALARVTGATVLFVHHTNKASRGPGGAVTAASGRGSSALIDGVRWGCALSAERVDGLAEEERDRLGEVVTLTFTKSNYSKKAEPLLLRRDSEHGGALVRLDELDLELIAEARRGGDKAALRDAAKAERIRGRAEREDTALVEIVAGNPGIDTRDLRAAVAAKLGIAVGAAGDAISRAITSGRVVRDGDRHKGFRHHIGGSQ